MALPVSVDFDGAAAGVAVTIANTPELTSQAGTNPTFSATVPTLADAGDLSALCDLAVTSFNSTDFGNVATAWFGFYFRYHALPTANSGLCSWLDGASKIGDFRQLTTGELQLRDNNTTVFTSSVPTISTWHRIAIKCVPNTATGHRLLIFEDGNLHGSVPDQDSGNQAATAAGLTVVDTFRFGVLSADAHWRVFRVRLAATEPAGMAGGASTGDIYHAFADSWVPITMKTAAGGSWS